MGNQVGNKFNTLNTGNILAIKWAAWKKKKTEVPTLLSLPACNHTQPTVNIFTPRKQWFWIWIKIGLTRWWEGAENTKTSPSKHLQSTVTGGHIFSLGNKVPALLFIQKDFAAAPVCICWQGQLGDFQAFPSQVCFKQFDPNKTFAKPSPRTGKANLSNRNKNLWGSFNSFPFCTNCGNNDARKCCCIKKAETSKMKVEEESPGNLFSRAFDLFAKPTVWWSGLTHNKGILQSHEDFEPNMLWLLCVNIFHCISP